MTGSSSTKPRTGGERPDAAHCLVQAALPQPDAADSLGHPGTTAPAGVRERQQGRFLAANSEYVAANQAGVAPLYAELQGFFNLTPPSVNAVLVQFERCSFTPRVFGKARAIEVRGTAAQLPPLQRTHKFRPQSGPRPLRAISGLQRHVPGHGGDAAQARVSRVWVRDLLAKVARSCCWRRRGWVWPAQCWIQSRRANSCRQSGSPATLAQEGRSVQALVKFRTGPAGHRLAPRARCRLAGYELTRVDGRVQFFEMEWDTPPPPTPRKWLSAEEGAVSIPSRLGPAAQFYEPGARQQSVRLMFPEVTACLDDSARPTWRALDPANSNSPGSGLPEREPP